MDMDVALNEEESAALQTALHSYLADLRMEIAGTDDRNFRGELKTERAALESIVGKLESARGESQLRDDSGREVVRVVSLWWTTESS